MSTIARSKGNNSKAMKEFWNRIVAKDLSIIDSSLVFIHPRGSVNFDLNRDCLHSKPLASNLVVHVESKIWYDFRGDFAPVCSENGRLKMAKKSS